MESNVNYSRDISVKHDIDVLVVGGGPAGCAAAWAAAMTGAKVLLIDGQGALGGMGTLGGVPAFMQFGDCKKILAKGFGRQLLINAASAKAVYPAKIPEDTGVAIAIHSEELKKVYDEMLISVGVKLSFCTQMIDVQCDKAKVQHVICAAKSGVFAIKAKIFVDCTGDGDLCVWAGADYEKGDADGNLMPGTLCSLYCNISEDAIAKTHVDKVNTLRQAIKDGIFTVPDLHLPGFFYLGQNVGGGNISHAFGLDATDELSLTHHFIDSRRRLGEYEYFYKKYYAGFDDMRLVATGTLLGVRETRRIICDLMLDIEHFKTRASFDDEIGRYCYPVDIHMSKPDEKLYAKFEKEHMIDYRYQPGESYGIPYRCLLPVGLDNVFVAGRCLGCDRYMQGSIRVMPGCFITGQAAGASAGMAMQHDNISRNVPVDKLIKQIESFDNF